MTNNNQSLLDNMLRATNIYTHAWGDYIRRNSQYMEFNPTDHIGNCSEVMSQIMSNPSLVMNHFMDLNQSYNQIFLDFLEHSNDRGDAVMNKKKDRIFSADEWFDHPMYAYIKAMHDTNRDHVIRFCKTIIELSGDTKSLKKMELYVKLMMDALSPANIPWLNPTVIKETFATSGQNLINGALNFQTDCQLAEEGYFNISLTDYKKFKVGHNIAATEGQVIYRNDILEVLQYKPTQKQVYSVPILLIPAWINKYYIMDLSEHNSLVKWLVEQGYNVFIISWVNPSSKHSSKGFEDYMQEGIIAALEQIQRYLGDKTPINCMGYCLGGTLLAATTAFLAQQKRQLINSTTFITTLMDFEDSGDIGVIIDDNTIEFLDKRMSDKGYLDGRDMLQTFNLIRSNDMIWSFYIENYFLGKRPKEFDILYWNADSTKLPKALHLYCLRNLYQANLLAKPGGLKIGKVPLDLGAIKTPSYVLATRKDHIVPWQSAYKAHSLLGGDVRFVLADSGHVAGVINPPADNRYKCWLPKSGHYAKDPNKWFESANPKQQSWWLDWNDWCKKNSGKKIESRSVYDSKNSLGAAPGEYVGMKCC